MDAFSLLLDYETRAGSGRHAPVRQEDAQKRWSGIAFRVGDNVLVAPMGEITEIIDPPVCSRVPGAKHWFLGIANVRGNLLPVTDLHGFMFGGRASTSRNARLLVHNVNGNYAGFKVDDILGMKQFSTDELSQEAIDLPESLIPFVGQGFKQRDQVWPVFSFTRFSTSREFLQIAK